MGLYYLWAFNILNLQIIRISVLNLASICWVESRLWDQESAPEGKQAESPIEGPPQTEMKFLVCFLCVQTLFAGFVHTETDDFMELSSM